MHFAVRGALGLVAISLADSHEDVEALHLLQTSSAKLSLHDDKKCNAARKATRDEHKQMKSDKKAVKEARNAFRAAQAALKESTTAHTAAATAEEAACPVPEVDQSPDQGCSDTLITSYTPGKSHYPQCPNMLGASGRGLPHGGGDPFWGFNKLVAGGGLPEGQKNGQKDIGISVLQPCSVGWTVGKLREPYGTNWQTGLTNTGMRVFKEVKNLKTACACREWADSQMKFPEAAAVQFYTTNQAGNPAGSSCKVFAFTNLEWIKNGFELSLDRSQNWHFSCYLGNPEEWKERAAQEKADGILIDKCSKTSLWSFGKLALQEWNAGYYSRTGPTWHDQVFAGKITHPDPPAGSEGGRKLCLRWVKKDPKCAGAIAIHLDQYQGNCYCSMTAPFQSDATSRPRRREPTEDNPSNGWTHSTCML